MLKKNVENNNFQIFNIFQTKQATKVFIKKIIMI